MKTGPVEGPLEKDHAGGVKTAAGSGDDENQRRLLLLIAQGVQELPLIPEHVGRGRSGKTFKPRSS